MVMKFIISKNFISKVNFPLNQLDKIDFDVYKYSKSARKKH